MGSVLLSFLFTTIRLSTPLSYAAVGGYASERSGTVNIALEGFMLISAFTSAAVAVQFGSPTLALSAGVLSAVLFSALHGFLCIELQADQIISGMAVNFFAVGLAPVLSRSLFSMTGGTPLLTDTQRIGSVLGVSPLVIGIFILIPASWIFHEHTRWGQYIRFAGAHPEALHTQGISVRRTRWLGVLLSGLFCGLAGCYLSIDHGSGFTRNMTAGRGFIALAALIVARWNPTGAVLASIGFGAVEAAQILLQGTVLPSGMPLPVQWIQIIPYAITIIILAATL